VISVNQIRRRWIYQPVYRDCCLLKRAWQRDFFV
jgi:hypothetical protein